MGGKAMKKILATVASACTALAVGAAVQLTASVYDDDTGGTYTGSGVFVEVTYSWWQGEEQEKGVDDVAVTVGDYNNVSYAIVRGCITNESIDLDKCKWKIAGDSSNLGFAVVDANASEEDLAAGYLTNRVVGLRTDGVGTYGKAAIVLHVARRYCTLTYDANGGDDSELPDSVEIVCGVSTQLTSGARAMRLEGGRSPLPALRQCTAPGLRLYFRKTRRFMPSGSQTTIWLPSTPTAAREPWLFSR